MMLLLVLLLLLYLSDVMYTLAVGCEQHHEQTATTCTQYSEEVLGAVHSRVNIRKPSVYSCSIGLYYDL
jgi:hypothetical protein